MCAAGGDDDGSKTKLDQGSARIDLVRPGGQLINWSCDWSCGSGCFVGAGGGGSGRQQQALETRLRLIREGAQEVIACDKKQCMRATQMAGDNTRNG